MGVLILLDIVVELVKDGEVELELVCIVEGNSILVCYGDQFGDDNEVLVCVQDQVGV